MEAPKPGRGQRNCPSCSAVCGVRSRVCNGCGYAFVEGESAPKPEPELRVITTFTEAGKGRKPCPCGIFVGVRSGSCPKCHHEFKQSDPTPLVAASPLATQEEGLLDEAWTNANAYESGHADIKGDLRKAKKQIHENSIGWKSDFPDTPLTTYTRPTTGRLSSPMASHDLPCPESGRRWQGSGNGFHRIAVPAGECPVKLRDVTREAVAEWIDGIQASFAKRREELTPYGVEYWLRDFHDLGTPGHKQGVEMIESIMGETTETY